MGVVSSETCWASYKHGIINFDTLLHLVGFFCMNCTMIHGSTNMKFTNKQLITGDLYRFSVVWAGSYEFHTISNCVDFAVWVSPMAYSFSQDNPESTELCAWWGMHASSPHSVHFTGIAACRLDTKLSANSKVVIVVFLLPHCVRADEVSCSCGHWREVADCEVSNYTSLNVTSKCVYRYFIKTFLFSVDNLDFITVVRVWPRKASLIWLFIVYFTTSAVSQTIYDMPLWLVNSEF